MILVAVQSLHTELSADRQCQLQYTNLVVVQSFLYVQHTKSSAHRRCRLQQINLVAMHFLVCSAYGIVC